MFAPKSSVVIQQVSAKLCKMFATSHHPVEKGDALDIDSAMSGVVRQSLQELSQPIALAFPDRDATQISISPFFLYCDACQDGFGAVRE